MNETGHRRREVELIASLPENLGIQVGSVGLQWFFSEARRSILPHFRESPQGFIRDCFYKFSTIAVESNLAQWKRAGLITRRSLDRNQKLLASFCLFF